MVLRCTICRKILDIKTAFVVANGKKPNYYCNEKEYKDGVLVYIKKQELKQKIKRVICEILSEKDIIVSALDEAMEQWNKIADDDKLYKYLVENKEKLTSSLDKIENNVTCRIKYLSKIIENNVTRYKPAEDDIGIDLNPETFDVKYKPVNKDIKKGFDELEDEVYG